MAKSKDDITYGAAQAKLSEDEALRVRYKAGTPLEGGKIAESEPIELFSSAHNIQRQQQQQNDDSAGNKIADSKPVDFYSAAHNIS